MRVNGFTDAKLATLSEFANTIVMQSDNLCTA
jgi:hypothetical protein